MSAIELLPCPFCKTGGLSFGNDMGRGVVQCHDCNAYIVADSEDEAITLWNTRADLPPTLSAAMELPEVQALVEAFKDQNELMRSALEIAKREGINGEIGTTNWDAYYNKVAVSLKRSASALAAIKEPKT